MEEIKELLSPRLKNLEKELGQGHHHAVEEFWAYVKKKGAPLVEAIEEDPEHQLVTFIAKGQKEVNHYIIMGSFAGYDFSKNVFKRLEGTDIYYKSYKFLNKARTTYQIAKNIPLVTEELYDNWDKYSRNIGSDPLNPRKTSWPEDTETTDYQPDFAVLELPNAPKQQWIHPREGVLKGNLEEVKITSRILDNDRRVWIYTPSGYDQSSGSYHLLVFFDGWAYINLGAAPTILDNLIEEDMIPPGVAVFIDNPSNQARDKELTCYEPFADFIAKELIPWLHKRYTITKDPAKAVVAGASYGGLAATFLGLRHSEIFGKVLSQSGSYWWSPTGTYTSPPMKEEDTEWLIKQFVKADRLPLELYLEVGKLETYDRMVITNRHFKDVLQCKDYDYHYSEFIGVHDFVCWRGTLSDGLIELIGITDETKERKT